MKTNENILNFSMKKGETVVLKNIFFEVSSAKLNKDSKNELKRILDFLNENKAAKILVGGHANQECDKCFALSEARAKAIVDWLTGKGIDPKRLTFKGYGFSRPLMPSTTREGVRANRRVDFTIVDF